MPGPAVSSRFSFQQHHLIPVSVGRRPQIGHFLIGLHLAGFHIEDAATNLIALPAGESDSQSESQSWRDLVKPSPYPYPGMRSK